MRKSLLASVGMLGLFHATPSQAVHVNWADFTTASDNEVSGSIDVDGVSVGITFSGPYSFAFLNGDAPYWSEGSPAPYTSGSVSNAPSADLIGLSQGSLKTITFSQPVTNPYLALLSWNGNSGSFNQALTPISSGCGYFGCGDFSNVTGSSFDGVSELHGIIRFSGTFSSVSFTDLDEDWHGIQVGVEGLAAAAAPEPATWAMMIVGFGMAGAAMRRRKHSYRLALT